MTRRTFQTSTLTTLRKLHEESSELAAKANTTARKHLTDAASYSARARDIAALLEEADPKWTAPDRPEDMRPLQIQAWRDAIDFIEQHPEIAVESYESFTIRPADGSETTIEWIESLEPLGIEITHTKRAISADLDFGEAGYRARLRAYKAIPEPEPITDPAAIEEHQALEGADQAAGKAIDEAVETSGHLPGEAIGDEIFAYIDAQLESAIETAEQLVDELATEGAEQLAPSREEQPIQVGDRVRVHAADATEHPALAADFPPQYEGRDGVVEDVDADAFLPDQPPAADPDDQPIGVLLAGETVAMNFAVAEVDVIDPADDVVLMGPQADGDVLVGEHA